MAINVYWTVFEKEWMRAKPPQNVLKNLYERKLHADTPSENFHKCPFTQDYLMNTYSLHSLYDYRFGIDGDNVFSEDYDQQFFNDHVYVRSVKNRFFSFMQSYIFFTDAKSLNMTLPIFPYLENNNITQRCMPFVGSFDIAKYFRGTDFAFFLKEPYNDFVIQQDEVFGYVNFDTKERIELKQFYPSQKLYSYMMATKNSTHYRDFKFMNPEYYYGNFKIKKNILKEIHENIIDV